MALCGKVPAGCSLPFWADAVIFKFVVESESMENRREPLSSGISPATSGLLLGSNFIWSLAGNVIFAACQWGMIVSLAKLGSSVMVGQFSLGLAVSTPMLMFSNLQLRAVQATDAKRLYSFGEYLQLRFSTSILAVAAVAAFAWIEKLGRETTLVVLAVALAKGTEALSDIHYGLFQLNDHLDQTGRSMMLRGMLSLAGLSSVLYLTRDVFWGCVSMAVVWLAILICWDVPKGSRFLGRSPQLGTVLLASLWRVWSTKHRFERQWTLVRLSVPLGIVTTLASINLNVPRYFIAARMGEYQLGIFSALAYATIALTLVSDSLGSCAIPQLARLYAAGQIAEFQVMVLKLFTFGVALGLAGLAVVQVAGKRMLTLFYGPEYAASSDAFVLLVLAAAIHCSASMLTSGILAARRFRVQAAMFTAVVGTSALACYRLVPTAGLHGGAMAMVAGAVVRLMLAAVILSHLVLVRPKYSGALHEGVPLG